MCQPAAVSANSSSRQIVIAGRIFIRRSEATMGVVTCIATFAALACAVGQVSSELRYGLGAPATAGIWSVSNKNGSERIFYEICQIIRIVLFYTMFVFCVEVLSESRHRCQEEFTQICEALEFCLKKFTTASMTMHIAGLVMTLGHSRENSQVCGI